MLLLLQVIGCAELAGFLGVGAYLMLTAPVNNNRPHTKPVAPRSARPWRILASLAIACLMLAACGGGGSTADPSRAVVSSVGQGGCEGGAANGCTAPVGDPEPTCAGQGYAGTFPSCICPQPYQTYVGASTANHVAGTCQGNPPAPTCPTGQSLTGYGAQCCPTGDTGNGAQCFAPPPTTCPSNTYGTPPNCQPIPSCSAVVGGYWGGSVCECPAGDTGTYPACQVPACPAGDTGTPPNCVPPPVCTGGYWGGNACECPAGDVGTYPNCIAQASITVTLLANVSPSTITDSNGGPTTDQATLTWSVSSNVPGDSFTCNVNGQPVLGGTSQGVGPYPPAQDGAITLTVGCADAWNVRQTQSVQLTVVPPAAPPQDTFTCAPDGAGGYTCSWYTYEPGAECYVWEYGNGGPEAAGVQLIPGGTSNGASGSAGVISPAYDPWTFTLQCNVPTNASPNPIQVTQ